MITNTDSDLNRKIDMAKSFLDSAKVLGRTTDLVFGDSPEEAESRIVDTRYRRKMSAHFLYAVVFELCIKIIWEVENNDPPKTNHDILSRYKELSRESRQTISDMYDTQVRNTKFILSQINSGITDEHGDVVNYSIKLQSLEDALKANQQTMRDFKYDGKLNGKSSVLCSVLWNNEDIILQPTAEIIVFPTSLLEYAISLNGQ